MGEAIDCSQPIGFFTVRGDKEKKMRYPAAYKSWTCPVCGERNKRRFLYCLNEASKRMMSQGYRFRGLTLTLGPEAKNMMMGKYWNRFRTSLKKSGYAFEYLWVKEFQENGKLHYHVLITAFIPWGVIRSYWKLATDGTSYIVWIAKAQVGHTAAYMAKYIAKDLTTAPFRKGERRYGMSKQFRKNWPKLKNKDNDPEKQGYEFNYKPDNSKLLNNVRGELVERKNRRTAWQSELSKDKKRKFKRTHVKTRHHKPKHNK